MKRVSIPRSCPSQAARPWGRVARTAGRIARCVGVLLLAGGLATPPAPARAESTPREYEIKAAFIYNFVKFVDWPSLPGSTITVGVLGSNPFGNALSTINGKSVKGKTLVVKQVGSMQEAGACQVLFISPSEAGRLHSVLETLRTASVLTVGESRGFAREGGIINFTLQDDKIRFEINPTAAERARLSISSQLLRLAKIVKS
jgi:hypothetical protein